MSTALSTRGPSFRSESSAPTAPAGYWWLKGGSRVSLLLHRRVVLVGGTLTLLTLALGVVAVGLGDSSLGFGDALRVLTGDGKPSARFIVVEMRLPRIVLAIAIGAALGTAGAIFQALTRNPLGSPDLIGFTMGAQTGILVVVVLFGGAFASVSMAALVGGLLTGAVIYLFSFRGGFGGLRLILAGIAISSMLGSFNRWLIVRADSETAYGALKAVTGTLSDAQWSVAVYATVLIALVTILAFSRSRDVHALHLGHDLAVALGTRVNRSQAVLVLLGTALVALATTAAGPISFVALVAPHLARMMSRTAVASMAVSAATGALLLLGADVLSQSVLGSMPVGIVTSAVGGVYFMGLLLVETRKRI